MADEDNEKDTPEYGQLWWKKQIEDTEKILEKKWWNAAENIISRYLDDRENEEGVQHFLGQRTDHDGGALRDASGSFGQTTEQRPER